MLRSGAISLMKILRNPGRAVFFFKSTRALFEPYFTIRIQKVKYKRIAGHMNIRKSQLMLLPGSVISRFISAGRAAAFVGVRRELHGFGREPIKSLIVASTQPTPRRYARRSRRDQCVVKQFKEKGYTGVASAAPDGATILRLGCARPSNGQRASVDRSAFSNVASRFTALL